MSTIYIIGAGASYGSIPLVNELAEDFIENFLPSGILGNYLADSRFVQEFSEKIKAFRSIDTLARSYFLANETYKYKELKFILDIYVSYCSIRGRSGGLEIYDDRKNELRCMGFTTDMLVKNDKNINDKIHIFSWNYDCLFEKSLSDLIGFHSITETKKFLTRLNGVIQLPRFCLDNKDKIPDNTLKDSLLLRFFLDYSEFLKSSKKSIEFSWDKIEDTSLSLTETEYTKLGNAKDVVIIGYSFPFYNRHIDKELLKKINPTANYIVQDPSSIAVSDILYDLLKSVRPSRWTPQRKKEKITTVSDVSNYYIPPRYDLTSI